MLITLIILGVFLWLLAGSVVLGLMYRVYGYGVGDFDADDCAILVVWPVFLVVLTVRYLIRPCMWVASKVAGQ